MLLAEFFLAAAQKHVEAWCGKLHRMLCESTSCDPAEWMGVGGDGYVVKEGQCNNQRHVGTRWKFLFPWTMARSVYSKKLQFGEWRVLLERCGFFITTALKLQNLRCDLDFGIHYRSLIQSLGIINCCHSPLCPQGYIFTLWSTWVCLIWWCLHPFSSFSWSDLSVFQRIWVLIHSITVCRWLSRPIKRI